MPPTEADLWKIYACKLKEVALSGQDLGPGNRIYLPLLNEAGILAGDNVPVAVTNQGVYRIGDTLVDVDNPLYTTANEGYAQRCRRYLANVWLATDPDPGVRITLDKATTRMNTDMDAYLAVNKEALAAWTLSDERKDKSMSQTDWLSLNYPNRAVLKKAWEGAATVVQQLNGQINGPLAAVLQGEIGKLENALGQSESACTMKAATYIGGSGAPPGSETTATSFVPRYNVDAAYGVNLTNWIAAATAKKPKQTISFSISETDNYDWNSIGFDSTTVKANGSVFPFFSAEYTYNGEKKKQDIKVQDFSSKIVVTLSGTGFASVGVNPDGSWNPGPIKKTYPTLAEHAPQGLADPIVLVNHIVVGYNIDTTFSLDRNTYNKISEIVNEASSHDASASASLFGFRLNLGGSGSHKSTTDTNWSDAKKSDDSCSITFPGRNDLVPKLLAVVGTVLKRGG